MEAQPLESTHATRNPLFPVIPPQTNIPKAKSKEEKNDTQSRKEALLEDYQAFFKWREDEIRELAKKHGKSEEHICKVVNNVTQLNRRRKGNVSNALVHYKAEEINEGLGPGERYSPTEICQAVKDDPDLQSLNDDELEELMKTFETDRLEWATGVRASNRAATQDFNRNSKLLHEEMAMMSRRMGAVGLAVFSRGHVSNTIKPTIFRTDSQILDFITDTFGMSPLEFSLKFDAWAVALDTRASPSNLPELQKECAKEIVNGLNKILNKKGVTMQYSKYEVEIRARYHIELRGWPQNIGCLCSPHAITTIQEIRRLQEALRSGECHWAAMTRHGVAELKENMKDAPRPPRKTQSDKGKPRGPHNKAMSGGDNGKGKQRGRNASPVRKKRKVMGGETMYKSNEFVHSSGEESGEED
ncbi:hypothetical protein NP233_g485 [Leucocoprinus birnbaumii]|uniref:Uncharacterized protein n=1 Tax=Leucocoprinus birnbaumii TaxID=56174 RepID=A0AAD5W1U6_9AGAR|nr:hypothetical protein NP233_g485 [Leucocoprinus birnbaumii]